MVRALLWVVRQRRYRALTAILWVVALACAGAGTFELHRFHEKQHDNAVLRANAQAAPVELSPSLVPLTGRSGPSNRDDKYRTVRATGTYDVSQERYVTDASQGGKQGFLVLTPLRTDAGVLLVARGFVAETAAGTRPARIPLPPAGRVTIAGRLYPGSSKAERDGVLGHGEITAANPRAQSVRLAVPVFTAYAALRAHQPGAAGLHLLAGPDLSNPSGGAGEAQLMSYVVQWYVFALLALVGPFALARAEIRDARRRYLGVDDDAVQFDLQAPPAGPALGAGTPGGGGELVVRPGAGVARAGAVATARFEHAQHLADRYGRTLGPDAAPDARAAAAARRVEPTFDSGARSSARVPHRSDDEYHGGYNDYLWQLALADGNIPDVVLPGDTARREAAEQEAPAPRVIDAGDGPATA